MKVLFVGDIVGKPGRAAAKASIPAYRDQVDLVIANGENAAGGTGITFEVADEIWAMGVDVITMGNHVWDKKEILEFIEDSDHIVRPLNYPRDPPGRGFCEVTCRDGTVATVMNACGRVFNPVLLEDPFRVLDEALQQVGAASPVILVDFHAEATSEKVAMGHYLDGRVSAVIGTHTHVQTNDAMVLPGGTGYVTDVGMTGPYDSVIGMKKDLIVGRFLTQMPCRFEAAGGPWQFNAALMEINPLSGRCLSINIICQRQNP